MAAGAGEKKSPGEAEDDEPFRFGNSDHRYGGAGRAGRANGICMEKDMKTRKITTLLAAVAMLGFAGCAEQTAKSGGGGGDPVELVLGTDGTKSPLFAMGNGIATAIALNAEGVAVFNYSTKGSKDNLKRLTKKKRAINLAAVSLGALEKFKDRNKVLGIMTLGSTRKKPDWVVLVVRPKPPKGVSKARYDNAIYQLVKALNNKKSRKVIKKAWKRWAPNRNQALFKIVGLKYHAAATRAFKDLGM